MTGRMLSEETCQIKARELIDCLMMWDIGKADTYRICVIMKAIAQNTDNAKWINPLKGTGYKIADAEAIGPDTAQELFMKSVAQNKSGEKPN